MKLSEESRLGVDLIEMRTRIAMYVLWTHGHSVASIAARMKRRESDVETWLAAGCPLQTLDSAAEAVDSALVTSVITPPI
jgi:hypothetical protein